MRATSPAHRTLFYFITVIIFDDAYVMNFLIMHNSPASLQKENVIKNTSWIQPQSKIPYR
jgi:hypothetical protein